MDTNITKDSMSPFERIKRINEYGADYWSARDLMDILEYSEFRGFESIIKKAMTACENSGQDIEEHFGQVNEMVEIGSNAKRERANYHISRYGCYLLVQNADSSKTPVALGQAYFATQTRKQEIQEIEHEDKTRLYLRHQMKDHNTKLADAAKDAGVVDSKDYAIFQNHGYMGLYGGLTAKEIHVRKGLKKSQKILDHMGSTELAANLFRATQTEEKLRREGIRGKRNANMAHLQVGEIVRRTIEELGGTMPEDLPSAESINKIARKYEVSIESGNEIQVLAGKEISAAIGQAAFSKEDVITPEEQAKKEFKIIDSNRWADILELLKSENHMVLYAALNGSVAHLNESTLKIDLPKGQDFTDHYLNKPEHIEFLKDFMSRNLSENVARIYLIKEIQ